jgi:hypothetical protein
MPSKVLVTSTTRLRAKYGAPGWKLIREAVARLVKADAGRGIATQLVSLDGSLGISGWRPGQDPAAFKNAIDSAYVRRKPDYLAILGGPDVIPHQNLANPVFAPPDDPDPSTPSDLPYACAARAGSGIEAFLGASRAVSRIPDLPGARDPRLLITILDQATRFTPPRVGAYDGCFGLTARVWRKSTAMSLEALLGRAAPPRSSPREGPDWSKANLAPLCHFINCHGAPSDPQFYGQSGREFPVAHRSDALPGIVPNGAVVSAECCYGAELYDPGRGTRGICVTYLQEGAIGFLGSTTVAYGPADKNESADLICRYFLESMKAGASLGRALLEARQRFVKEAAPLSPIDLKTIAQFLLLGDPSLRPVGRSLDPRTKSFATGVARHTARRRRLAREASKLATETETVASVDEGPAPRQARARMMEAAHRNGLLPSGGVKSFSVHLARRAAAPKARAAAAAPRVRFHILCARPADVEAAPARPARGKAIRAMAEVSTARHGPPSHVILLGREIGGKMREVEELYAHRLAGNDDRAAFRRPGRSEAVRSRVEERAASRGPGNGRTGAGASSRRR